MQTLQEFFQWESFSRDTIDVKRIYIDMAGDLVSGVLLSQIIFWHLPNKETGERKLKVFKEDYYWLVKNRTDWWKECRITPKQFDRSIEVLEKSGIVITKLIKFNGAPTKHIRINGDKFLEMLNQKMKEAAEGEMDIDERVKSKLPKGENPNSQEVKPDIDETVKSLTENTPETTPENYSILFNIPITEIWEKAKIKLKGELPEVSYNTWINSIIKIGVVDEVLILYVDSELAKEILEAKYLQIIKKCIEKVVEKDVNTIIRI